MRMSCIMSGSSGSNSEAVSLQKQSLEESRRANDAQLQFLAKQTAALEKNKLPAYRPAAPPPTPGTSGADYAGMQERLAAGRRFGYKNTVRGGANLGNA